MTKHDGKILMVVTSTPHMGMDGAATGFWLSTLAAPYFVLVDHGYTVDISSPKGGEPPADPNSWSAPLPGEREALSRYLTDASLRGKLEQTIPLAKVKDEYRAVVLCGGRGAMWDFPYNEALSKLLVRLNDRGAVIASIGHGAAGFVGAIHPDGENVVGGRSIRCFRDMEEIGSGFASTIPFLLEERLRSMGVKAMDREAPLPQVLIQGNLITTEGPSHIQEFGTKLIEVLHEQNMSHAGLAS